MDSIKQGANFVAEKTQQAVSGTSKEANKEVAKDSNAPIGTRYASLLFTSSLSSILLTHHHSASAAKDALGDKAQETKHDAKGEAHKEAI